MQKNHLTKSHIHLWKKYLGKFRMEGVSINLIKITKKPTTSTITEVWTIFSFQKIVSTREADIFPFLEASFDWITSLHNRKIANWYVHLALLQKYTWHIREDLHRAPTSRPVLFCHLGSRASHFSRKETPGSDWTQNLCSLELTQWVWL